MKVFLSYNFQNTKFVRLVNKFLVQQKPIIEPYFYTTHKDSQQWSKQLSEAIKNCEAFILFLGKKLGNTQEGEMKTVIVNSDIKHKIWVKLANKPDLKANVYCSGLDPIFVDPTKVKQNDDFEALKCAKKIMTLLKLRWIPPDDIPAGYLFDYEKDIIQTFLKNDESSLLTHIISDWPNVEKNKNEATVINPLSSQTIGEYRKETDCITVDIRTAFNNKDLTFPEAGPRESLCYPNVKHPEMLKVGILVSGGIAPGINAVIDGIVHRHHLYAKPPRSAERKGAIYNPYIVQVFGYIEGFKALLRGSGNYQDLTVSETSKHAHNGGSIIGTSRVPELLDRSPDNRIMNIRKIINTLIADKIEILYIIGGDGSMRAAHALYTIARNEYPEHNLSIIGIPKTMDNDILWVWQSFGFLSAVEKAKEAILHLQTEVKSNPRLCIIQLFGSDSGFVVAHAVLASGGCDYALIPEVGFTMEKLCDRIKQILKKRFLEERKPYGIIVMSETAIPSDVEKYIDKVGLSKEEKEAIKKFACIGTPPEDEAFKRRVQGQTPDELRTGGLKIVSKILEKEIRSIEGYEGYWENFRVFTNEPRHTIRAVSPSALDVIFGQRVGALTVDNALAGYTDFMISQWLTEYVLVPLKLVVLGRKRVPKNGIFWKSVLASTEQPIEEFDD